MFYRDGQLALQKAIVGRNLRKVNAELENLDGLVKKHNQEHPEALCSMSKILSEPFSSLHRKDRTPLEFAVEDGSSTIADALRNYGAPETARTAYFPGFWNSLYGTPTAAPTPAVQVEESKTQASTKP